MYTHTYTHTDKYWFSGKVQPKSMFSNCHQWTYSQVCPWQHFLPLKTKDRSSKTLGVITHPKPDILKCKVKWALGSITTKPSGGDGIPVELFQILKADAVKVLHSICQQIWKTQQWPQDWKRSVFIPIPKKGNAKERSNYCTIALISHASKVRLKSL